MIKVRINRALVYFKRTYNIDVDYILLDDKDFVELSHIKDSVDVDRMGDSYTLWSTTCLERGKANIKELLESNPKIKNHRTITDDFDGMLLVGFSRILNLVDDQELDPGLYDRPFALSENFRYNDENLNKLIYQFRHPYVKLFTGGFNNKILKFETSYQYKHYAKEYRDLVMGFIEEYKKNHINQKEN